jgi:hypothetical protein
MAIREDYWPDHVTIVRQPDVPEKRTHGRRLSGNHSPPNRSQNASASSGLAKQNTTKSLSSRRREYVSYATVGGDA